MTSNAPSCRCLRPTLRRALCAALALATAALLGAVAWATGVEKQRTAEANYEADLARFKRALGWERSGHRVALPKPLYIGKYEITQEQYQQVVGSNPSRFSGRKLPAEQVPWHDAREFCKQVADLTKSNIRLPSEAEWEYACRAGTKTAYCSGDTEKDLGEFAWYGSNSGNRTHAVGQKRPNAFGLYDMHGNVSEWCEDDWHKRYEGAPNNGHAWIDKPRGETRVTRGGGWRQLRPEYCRSTFRSAGNPHGRSAYIGLRVLLELP